MVVTFGNPGVACGDKGRNALSRTLGKQACIEVDRRPRRVGFATDEADVHDRVKQCLHVVSDGGIEPSGRIRANDKIRLCAGRGADQTLYVK